MLLRSVFITVLFFAFSVWSQFTIDSNTLALYHFDEGQGTVATDASPNHWDGTLAGCTWVTGRFGKGLNFNGTSDFVTVGHPLPIRNISFEMWVHSTDTLSGGFPLNTYGGYDQGFRVDFSKDSAFFFTSVSRDAEPRGAFPNKQSWIYLAATIDPLDTTRLYINGNLVDSRFDVAVARVWSAFYFGAVPNSGTMTNFYRGIVDEARISKCVRTPTEIKNAYIATPLTLLSAVASGNQVLLSFNQFTGTPVITSSDIDSILPISHGHTWLSGFGIIDSAIWNPSGTKLLVTLSVAFSSPTISIGDSISFSLGSGKVTLSGTLDLSATLQNHTVLEEGKSSLMILNSVIYFSIPEQYRCDKARLDIYDLSGRVLLSSQIITKNSGRFLYPLPRLSKGCFLVSLKTGNGFYQSVKWAGAN